MSTSRLFTNVPLIATLLVAAGCARDWTPREEGSARVQGRAASAAEAATTLPVSARRPGTGFASLPDRGNLVGYPDRRVVRQDGAYTWHRADLSEKHALAAIIDGTLDVATPSGESLRFRYERHVEHPSGDWTWIGRLEGGARSDEVVVTFGDKAAFGTIAQPGKAPLKLTIEGGVSWLVETDPARIATIDNAATRPDGPDYFIPPSSVGSLQSDTAPFAAAAPAQAASTASGGPTVDLVLGFTSGYAAALGGASQAVTRLHNLVDLTNQAYANSQIPGRVRLVHSLQVDFPDATDNGDALEKLSGYRSGSGRLTPDPAFGALRAARDQYGADLVSLVRKFNTPENDGCGIAWLVGGGRSGIDASDEFFGYSVVSDGRDADTDGKNYFCRDETLAHELGHNMGSQHDRAAADGDDNVLDSKEYGAFDYSFGYKANAGAGTFYTVMAYGDSGQTPYRVFSNPRTTFCGGAPCGAGDADNARSLEQTMPVIASFRATVVAERRIPNLLTIARNGASGRTEVHGLSGASNYVAFNRHVATALHGTGSDAGWRFLAGDYNRDGIDDLFVIARNGGSNSTEVHVLNGATNYQSFLLQVASALHVTGTADDWGFKLGDYNRDGLLDIYVIARNGGSGRTEVHVLNGASQYRSFVAHIATALHRTGSDGAWAFEVGDWNRDGYPDLFAIAKSNTGSNTTEVHVLDGASLFQRFILNRATGLHTTGSGYAWDFAAGDYNGDGVLDLYTLNKRGGSGTTEVHVLDGASGFAGFTAHVASGLHNTPSDHSWEFEIGG